MFLVTVPVGFLVIDAIGVWSSRQRWWRESRLTFATAGGVWILFLFSLPGTPVYDGVRLFLMVFPLWALAVGLGMRRLLELGPLRDFSARRR